MAAAVLPPDLPTTIAIPAGALPFQAAEVIPSDDPARVAVRWPAGAATVLSVQPDGSLETRPDTAIGAYEKAVLDGDRLVYEPVPGTVWVIPYVRRA